MADLPADSTPVTPALLPAAPIAAACGLVAAGAYIAAVDPSRGGIFPACPHRALTGWWCPGCGLTRATHHLVHADVIGALRYNALTPLVLSLVLFLWVDWYRRSIGQRSSLGRIPGWAAPVGVAVAVGVAV